VAPPVLMRRKRLFRAPTHRRHRSALPMPTSRLVTTNTRRLDVVEPRVASFIAVDGSRRVDSSHRSGAVNRDSQCDMPTVDLMAVSSHLCRGSRPSTWSNVQHGETLPACARPLRRLWRCARMPAPIGTLATIEPGAEDGLNVLQATDRLTGSRLHA